ncbi:Hypothetical_protein [Hexamita inflata]|uniref:Hypothetical_protein n=1 Tax=Hexamita inflata TaxID=28002 RepID=A0AA86PL59_9EUKA|nr:Hypothetical protein HINF_LOCUS25180 [Hexamita inflata]CAI9947966.1 Hypothetical protein HINF_LOCUS35611 [Hexamita inflata]
MTSRQLGWKINKDVIPESKDATKEYKWYESSGWKLVNIKTENIVDEAGVPIKPVDKPGYILKLNSKNKWSYHVDMTDRNNKPYCNKKDKDYFWNEKVKAWKLANVVYADKDDKYSFVASPVKQESKVESKVETKVETKQEEPKVDDSKQRQEQIEKQIDLYYQKKEQELKAKMQQVQQSQAPQAPVQAPQVPVQQTKVVFDNPLLSKYM